MPGAKIPTEIETAIETTCIAWPAGDEWYALLIGAISDLARASYWDPNSGDPEVAAEWALRAVYATLDEESCMIPTGAMMAYAGAIAPAGWVLRDGSYYDSTDPTYAALFAVCGETYGPMIGDLFRVPDGRGRVGVGYNPGQDLGGTLGETGGAATHTLSTAEMPAHSHAWNCRTAATTGVNYTDTPGTSARLVSGGFNGSEQARSPLILPTGDGADHNNLQPYLVINYIIKL